MMIDRICSFGQRTVLIYSFVLLISLIVHAQTSFSKPHKLWDKKELHKAPDFQWTGVQNGVRSLLYSGVSYKNAETEVFAFYSNPDLIVGKVNTGKRYPAVVLVHGSGGTAFREWVEKWARAGYAAIAMDLTGKDSEGKRLAKGGADQSDETMFTDIKYGRLKDMWTYQCVANIMLSHSLLLSFPEVDQQRTAITGISRGGYMTCVAAGVDHRFKAAVPVYGCGFIDESEVLKHGLNRLDELWKKCWIENFDPAVYFPQVRMPVLLLNGNKDKFYNVVPYAKSYDLLPKKYRYICIKPDMGHSHTAGWEPIEIKDFFDAVFNGREKFLSRVEVVTNTKDGLKAKTSPAKQIKYAAFYYSNDTTSQNSDRVWHSRPVQHDSRKNQVIIPNNITYNYGFLFFTDTRGISFSSNFLITGK